MFYKEGYNCLSKDIKISMKSVYILSFRYSVGSLVTSHFSYFHLNENENLHAHTCVLNGSNEELRDIMTRLKSNIWSRGLARCIVMDKRPIQRLSRSQSPGISINWPHVPSRAFKSDAVVVTAEHRV